MWNLSNKKWDIANKIKDIANKVWETSNKVEDICLKEIVNKLLCILLFVTICLNIIN